MMMYQGKREGQLLLSLYHNKLLRDDIECRKVRYHRSRIFACIFLQIRSSPGKSMVARCFVDGLRLWIRLTPLSKPYFSMSWDFGSERGDNRIHSFGWLNKGLDYKCYVPNNYLMTSVYRSIPTLSTIFGEVQRSNSHK